MLTRDEIIRYSRNILLPEMGRAGQEKLKSSHVFVVGAGGLGSPVLLYLCAAGVGTISFIDNDNLELTNLQRQILFQTSDLNTPKAYSGAEKLRSLNPEIDIRPIRDRLSVNNIERYLAPADLVIETSDNFATKFLTNDACYFLKKPLIIGGILRFEGQAFVIDPGRSACYRCLFGEPPPEHSVPTCADAGVLGAVAGVIGSYQAVEALRLLAGIGPPSSGRLLVADLLQGDFRKLEIPRNPSCPLCGSNPEIGSLRAARYPGSCQGRIDREEE